MNNNLMIFEGNDVEVFEFNGQVLFNPKHVAKILDIKNINDNLRKMNKNQVVKLTNSDVRHINFRKLHNTGENFLTESGVLKIIDSCRNQKEDVKVRLIKFLFPNKDIIVINNAKEIQFLDALEDVLSAFDINGIRQYNVENYRIDLYLPKLKIAIEYDENGHKNYTYKNHELRELIIKNKLHCKFIRITDSVSNNKNIGFVLRELLKEGFLKLPPLLSYYCAYMV